MVLPPVPLALIGTGVVSGASGAAIALKGGYDVKRANDRIRNAGTCYDQERRKLEAHELVTNESLKVLGTRQEQTIQMVVERMADFLRRNEKQVTESEKLLVDGLGSTPGQVMLGGSLGQDAISWIRGIVGAAVTGVRINTGITTAVTSFATASTGTAISTLFWCGRDERDTCLSRRWQQSLGWRREGSRSSRPQLRHDWARDPRGWLCGDRAG